MLPFTLWGLLGLLVGALTGSGAGFLLLRSGMSPVDSFAWGAQVGALTCGLFGVLTDRPHQGNFWPSYRALLHRADRVALAAVPLAFYPMMTVGIAAIVWAVLRTNALWWATYIATAVGTSLVTVLFFETRRPVVSYAMASPLSYQPSMPAATPVARSSSTGVGPMTEEELAPYRRRGRWSAVFMLFVGGASFYWVDHLVRNGDRIPMKLVGIVAIGFGSGLIGLFEPLIMYRHKPEGKRFPRSANLMMVLTVVVMAAIVIGIVLLYGLH